MRSSAHKLTRHAALFLALLAPAAAYAEAPSAPQAPPQAQASDAVHKDKARVTATLLFDQEEVAPGETVRAGVHMALDEGWHVYWFNSGDAGLPTQIKWSTAGETPLTFSPMRWPAPEVFVESGGEVTTYGYHHEVLHDVSVEVPKTLTPGQKLTIHAEVDFLTCEEICVPGHISLSRELVVAARSLPSADQQRFEAQATTLPQAPEQRGITYAIQQDPAQLQPGATIEAILELDLCAQQPCARPYKLDATQPERAFIPLAAERVVWQTKRVELGERLARVTLSGKLAARLDLEQDKIGGVLRLSQGGQPAHILIEAMTTLRPSAPALAATPPQQQPSLEAGDAPKAAAPAELATTSLLGMLVMAFLGGILLNAMPCVFPVLTLKIAALAELAHKDNKLLRAHGFAYAAGILGTMLALALVVITLKLMSAQVGWGFQFQSPWFLIGLSAALTLFALNLFGLFEVGMPFAGRLSGLSMTKDGLPRSFAEGLLCVLLSTPCSAPFMGTAMGFALVSEPPITIALFLSLGAGLAAPFVLLTMLPKWRKLLPKPGNWLLRLKQFLGFTLLGTCWWLLWILGTGYGADRLVGAGVFLLLLSLAAWLYGTVQFAATRAKRAGIVATLMILGLGAAILVQTKDSVVAPTAQLGSDGAAGAADAHGWRPFDEAQIAQTLAEGQPVFVDFTADWCITCKVNERTVLARDEVERAFEAHKVVKFKADWTKRDERIRAILARHKKAGVPMYLLYSPARPDAPEVLPEVLTAGLIKAALARAAQ